MKLIFATLYLGQSRVVAVVEETGGKQRKIELRWQSATALDVPPPTWFEAVCAEAEDQRSNEARPNVMGLFR